MAGILFKQATGQEVTAADAFAVLANMIPVPDKSYLNLPLDYLGPGLEFLLGGAISGGADGSNVLGKGTEPLLQAGGMRVL